MSFCPMPSSNMRVNDGYGGSNGSGPEKADRKLTGASLSDKDRRIPQTTPTNLYGS